MGLTIGKLVRFRRDSSVASYTASPADAASIEQHQEVEVDVETSSLEAIPKDSSIGTKVRVTKRAAKYNDINADDAFPSEGPKEENGNASSAPSPSSDGSDVTRPVVLKMGSSSGSIQHMQQSRITRPGVAPPEEHPRGGHAAETGSWMSSSISPRNEERDPCSGLEGQASSAVASQSRPIPSSTTTSGIHRGGGLLSSFTFSFRSSKRRVTSESADAIVILDRRQDASTSDDRLGSSDDFTGSAVASPRRALDHRPSMPRTWKRGESLGSGSFGNVFLALSDNGELLAVKEVSLNNGELKDVHHTLEDLQQEIKLLSTLRHPNIVQYVGAQHIDMSHTPISLGALSGHHQYSNGHQLGQNSFYIFLEYVEGGSISSMLTRFGRFEESVIRVYTAQILAGLSFLHSTKTMHRDIKGANILVGKDGQVKLADFGMAKTLLDGMTCTRSFKGSPFWMAPESVRQQGSDLSSDIWSVGCTMIEMATARPPWIGQVSNQVQAIFMIGNGSDLPEIPDHLSPLCREFIGCCLQRDADKRPTAAQLLTHPFFRIPPPHSSSLKRTAAEGGAGGGTNVAADDEFDLQSTPFAPLPIPSSTKSKAAMHRRVRSEGGEKLDPFSGSSFRKLV